MSAQKNGAIPLKIDDSGTSGSIDLFDPNWKPDVGCMFGDMVVVRGNRAERLVDVPLELPEIG